MSFSIVQFQNAVASGTTTSLTATFTNNITAGNLIVVGYQMPSSGTTVTVSDGPGDTFTNTFSNVAWTDGTFGGSFAPNSAGGSKTVTLSYASTSQTPTIVCAEISGVATSSPLDTSGSSTGTSSSPGSGLYATSNANDIIIGFDVGAKTLSTTGGMTTITSNTTSWNTYLMYEIETTTGSYGFIGGQASSGAWAAWMMAFKNPQSNSPIGRDITDLNNTLGANIMQAVNRASTY